MGSLCKYLISSQGKDKPKKKMGLEERVPRVRVSRAENRNIFFSSIF